MVNMTSRQGRWPGCGFVALQTGFIPQQRIGQRGLVCTTRRADSNGFRTAGVAARRRVADVSMGRSKVDSYGKEYITLESFMKIQGVCDTGGQAKVMIQGGNVLVNDAVETRRGRKLRSGDRVQVDGTDDTSFEVLFDGDASQTA